MNLRKHLLARIDKLALTLLLIGAVVSVGVASAEEIEPFAEAMPGTFEQHEQDPTIGDAVEQGTFTLSSVMKLESARMPVLVDIFPQYSPRNQTTEWGRGWQAAYLTISRTRIEGAPRFDAQDGFASAWGTLQIAGNFLYVRGFSSKVEGQFDGNKFVLLDEHGTTWTYDGTRYLGPRGIERWELTRVADTFGNAVALSYDSFGNLETARWTRQDLLAHQVTLSYVTVGTVAASEVVAGVERTIKQRIEKVVVSNTHRDTGTLVPVVTYILQFKAQREWLLTSVVEQRGGQSRTTTYQYGKPWIATNDPLRGKVVKSAATLPTYPMLTPPEHALASTKLTALDVSNDGGTAVMTKAGLWWIFDHQKREYVLSSFLDDPDPECVDLNAPWPKLLRFRIGNDQDSYLVRLVLKQKDTLELTQCSLPGEVIARTRLTVPRPPPVPGCEAIKPGPIEHKGAWPFSLADLDADGVPDLSVADACRLLVWYGSRGYGDKLDFADSADIIEVAGLDPTITNVVLDYNGDGLVDVIDYSRQHRLWLNRGSLRDRTPHFNTVKILEKPDQWTGTCMRYLLHIDTDRFLDSMRACQLHDVDPATGMGSFQFYFSLGDSDRLRLVRGVGDVRWVAGWPSNLTVAEYPGPGLTFIELLPMSRSSEDKCHDGAAKGETRGPSGRQYWCSPGVHWMSLAGPDADLLTKVDNGRGVMTTFTYAWSTFPVKSGRGPSVLASKTRHVIGRDSVTSSFLYEDPWFEGRAHKFGGFRNITRTDRYGSLQYGAKKTSTFTFTVKNDIAARTEAKVQGSDGSIRGTRWNYDWKERDGMPLVRLAGLSKTLTLAGVTSERTHTYFTYARNIDVCPERLTWHLLAGKKMRSITVLEYKRPNHSSGLACLESKRIITATHTDMPVFVEQVLSAHTGKGQLTHVLAVSGNTEITMQKRTYADDGNPKTASAGTGTVLFTSYHGLQSGQTKRATTSLLGRIDLPDGRTIEIDYDPVTDQPLVLRASRTDKTGKQFVRRVVRTTDEWSRLVSEASDEGTGAATAWRTIEYRDATLYTLGAQWTTNKAAGAASAQRRLSVLDGRQQVIAELVATGTTGTKTRWWLESGLHVNDERNEILHIVGGEVELDAGAVPETWKFGSLYSTTTQRRKRAPGSLASEVIEKAGSHELVWKTTATLDPSGLLVITRSDGARTEHQRFDGANRLVSTTTFSGETRTAEYDARGRLRKLLLPGIIAGTDYDAWGRVAGTTHGDIAVSYAYVPGKLQVACEKTTGGALTLKTCFEYNAIGQRTARRSSTNGVLDDVARWSYEPGFASPTTIEGPNYKMELTSDGVEGFGQARSTLRKTVFPFAESVQDPPRHDPAQVISFLDTADYRADGSIAKKRTTIEHNGVTTPGGDVACAETRDAFGATAQWNCGRFSIGKSTSVKSTIYTLSNGRTLTVEHHDGRRRWDKIISSQQNTQRWSLHRMIGPQLWTGGESFNGGLTGFDRFDDGALKKVEQWPKLPSLLESYTYDPLGLVTSTLGTPIHRLGQDITLGTSVWRRDDLGRFTSADGATATWNAQNQITTAMRGGLTARYAHDVMGQRLLRAETGASKRKGATVWKLWHGGVQVVLAALTSQAPPRVYEVRIPVELDGHIFTVLTEDGTRDVEYDATNNLIVVDGAWMGGTAFGHRATHATDVPEYAGAYFDNLLGTYRFGVRDYVPELAQFSSPDPLVLRTPSIARDARSSNLYSYARANPHDFMDPSGLEECQTTTEGCTGGTSISSGDQIAQWCKELGGGCGPTAEVRVEWPEERPSWGDPHEDAPGDMEGGYEPPVARDPSDYYQLPVKSPVQYYAGFASVYYGAEMRAFLTLKLTTPGVYTFGVPGVAAVGGLAAGALAGMFILSAVTIYEHQVNSLTANMHQVFLNPSTPPARRK